MLNPKLTLARFLSGVLLGIFVLIVWGGPLSSEASAIRGARTKIDDIFFVDSAHGWLLSRQGAQQVLLRTVDGGDHWSAQATPYSLMRLFFLTRDLGWSTCGEVLPDTTVRTSLCQTKDGGATWSRHGVLAEPSLRGDTIIDEFRFLDSNNGWFVAQGAGGARVVLNTENGGDSFRLVDSLPGKELLQSIYSQPPDKIWMFGSNTILASFDTGRTWSTQIGDQHPLDDEHILVKRGQILADGLGFAAGQGSGPTILGTSDYGRIWRVVFQGQDSFFTDISFINKLSGCAITMDARLFCTSDGGETWRHTKVPFNFQKANPQYRNTRVLFSSPSRVWLVSDQGLLYRSDDAGRTWNAVSLPSSPDLSH